MPEQRADDLLPGAHDGVAAAGGVAGAVAVCRGAFDEALGRREDAVEEKVMPCMPTTRRQR
jgi:hypothetical protein